MFATAHTGTAAPETSPRPLFVAAPVASFEPQDAPIDPGWILAGTPRARSACHSVARDGLASTHVWDCSAGTFRWHFGWEETVHILDGAVHITTETGEQRTLGVGDVAYFAAGTWATWEIPVYLKKLAFCRRAMPKPVRLVLQARDAAGLAMKRFKRG